jgi:hypothetical protein
MNYKLLLILFFSLLGHAISAQVFMQIEKNNDPETIKFGITNIVEFKHADYPDEWQRGEIEQILYDDNVVVFTNQIVHLDDIIAIKIYRPGVKALGQTILAFSYAWAVYGTIAALASDQFSIGLNEILIGGFGILTGTLIKKFSSTTYNMGKSYRLRIVDLRFPSPEEMYQISRP